jgi:phosphomannomutase
VAVPTSLTAFKAYDVRGKVPDELDEPMAVLIGRAFARLLGAKTVAVGRDARETGPGLVAALVRGLTESGVDVVDIGQVGTEEIYFATYHLGLDGGVMVTASHNPGEYNGMKFVREDARPISSDNGLKDIEAMVLEAMAGGGAVAAAPVGVTPGTVRAVDNKSAYVAHLLTHVEPGRLRPLRIVANCGNGMAGPVLRLLQPHLPVDLMLVYPEVDGTFPHGIPNPLLPENQGVTSSAVVEHRADLGLAWDGDFDRCFFFDDQGRFVDGYYLVGLLAQRLLRDEPGGRIIHDPRLVWNTLELVEAAGGVAVQSKSGHAFIKQVMREHDAVYGGEMSAHHYFRSFSYCDSGMIPWLLVVDLLSATGRSLADLVDERIARFPVSGEINREVADPAHAVTQLRARYGAQALSIDEIDGVSLEFDHWRCNLRPSNTEPVIRLNVETRGDPELLGQKTNELLQFLAEEV